MECDPNACERLLLVLHGRTRVCVNSSVIEAPGLPLEQHPLNNHLSMYNNNPSSKKNNKTKRKQQQKQHSRQQYCVDSPAPLRESFQSSHSVFSS